MVKVMLIFLVIMITLLGCSYAIDLTTGCEDLESLCLYVHVSIEYVNEASDYFQSPIETENLRTGDCEDYTIYFMYLANKELNIKPQLVVVYITDIGFHAITEYDGVYYDPTKNMIFKELPATWSHIISYDYDIIMIYATEFYTKETKF